MLPSLLCTRTQLGPKLLLAGNKANTAITQAADLLKAREDRNHKSNLEKAHRAAITELSACKQRLEDVKSLVARHNLASEDLSQALAKADVRVVCSTAHAFGQAGATQIPVPIYTYMYTHLHIHIHLPTPTRCLWES